MARICKSKGCTNEIPEGWRSHIAMPAAIRRPRRPETGSRLWVATVTVGGTILVVGKDVVVDVAKSVLKR